LFCFSSTLLLYDLSDHIFDTYSPLILGEDIFS
jgi:hypothetical protein